VCSWIKDGLLKLSQGNRVVHYIPDLSWKIVQEDLGISSTVRHLVVQDASGQGGGVEDKLSVLGIILKLLDVDESEFSPDVALTTYGLDSLGATRISEAIRSFANVSQMQLLGGMTWKQLEEKLNLTEDGVENAPSPE
jgi:aryl carrier-like protein